jgi:hypothetical protein
LNQDPPELLESGPVSDDDINDEDIHRAFQDTRHSSAYPSLNPNNPGRLSTTPTLWPHSALQLQASETVTLGEASQIPQTPLPQVDALSHIPVGNELQFTDTSVPIDLTGTGYCDYEFSPVLPMTMSNEIADSMQTGYL